MEIHKIAECTVTYHWFLRKISLATLSSDINPCYAIWAPPVNIWINAVAFFFVHLNEIRRPSNIAIAVPFPVLLPNVLGLLHVLVEVQQPDGQVIAVQHIG